MIDNFEIIKKFLKEHSLMEKNDFYFLQVIRRKKDNPDMTKHEFNIYNFYLTSLADFDKYKPRIMDLCQLHNARCLIRLGKRNYEQIAKETQYIIADCIRKGNYHSVMGAYVSACGQFSAEKKKLWMVDIDDNAYLDEVCEHLKEITTIHGIIPSKTGSHIIISGFNPKLFKYNKDTHPVELKKEATTNIVC